MSVDEIQQVILHINRYAFMWYICDRGFSRCVPSTWHHLKFQFLLNMFKYCQSISKWLQQSIIHISCCPDGTCSCLIRSRFGDQIYHAQIRKALVTLIDSENLERYKPSRCTSVCINVLLCHKQPQIYHF